jgi:hypothetical protein
MTLKEAHNLKAGDAVIWPAGANGCAECRGVITLDEKNDALYAAWHDGQRTYLLDKDAVKYIKPAVGGEKSEEK